MPTEGIDWRTAAYHEAGHAAIAGILRKPPTLLTAIDTPQGLPACEFDWPDWHVATAEEVQEVAQRAIAGPIAEYFLTGEYNWAGWTNDLNTLDACFKLLSASGAAPDTFEEFWQQTMETVTPTLERHWQAVDAIAAEVLKHKQNTNLDGSRLQEIIARANQTLPEKRPTLTDNRE